ncbi:hypothetical protein [Mesorhizobium sp.]|uniref:hypothetical protein n=2 Tax=Mesorhizobium sp. TaxID=1871066 RepID=UPI000FEAA502|nr:hypothetical protein [Mesorhizobium sp.]RWD47457.1 MAG: hypothetical protein EOS35_06340 [Mesorhizobium sp.]
MCSSPARRRNKLPKNPIIRFCDEAWIFIVRKNGDVHVAVVDWEDVEKISGLAWGYHPDGYAMARKGGRGKRTGHYLHREVLDVDDPEIIVDHIDHDEMNCRKNNLRMTDKSNNGFHRKKFCGVYFSNRSQKWVAALGIPKQDRPQYIGAFSSKLQAQQAVVTELYKIDPVAAKHREELMNAENY